MSAHAILKRDFELDFDQRCTKGESGDKTVFFLFSCENEVFHFRSNPLFLFTTVIILTLILEVFKTIVFNVILS